MRRHGRTVLLIVTGVGAPLVFPGIAGLINGHTLVGLVLIAVSAVCTPVWIRLRRGFR